MGKGSGDLWLRLGWLCLLGLSVQAQPSGLSAVLNEDQHYSTQQRYSSGVSINDWVTSGAPGLFKTGEFLSKANSSFTVTTAGVYYVTAHIVVEAGRQQYGRYYYYYNDNMYGRVQARTQHSYYYSQRISSTVQFRDRTAQQVSLRLSGYTNLASLSSVKVQLTCSGRSLTIKAGSTFSLMYTSKATAFPGLQLYTDSKTLSFRGSKSANITQWKDKKTRKPRSTTKQGYIIAPVDGVYHVIANIRVYRFRESDFRFAILVDSTTEAVSKTTKLVSGGTTTITLEGVLNLTQNQTISVRVFSNNSTFAIITVSYGSSLSVCLRGALGRLVPGLSVRATTSPTELLANRWNTISQWQSSSTQTPTLFGHSWLHSGAFVSPKSGFYYVSLTIYVSNCSMASAKLILQEAQNNNTGRSVGPGFAFSSNTPQCHLDISLVVYIRKNESLSIAVKSHKPFIVEPNTTFQVLYLYEFVSWPVARLIPRKPIPLYANKPAVQVTGWVFSDDTTIGNMMVFSITEEKIRIKISGLYIVSCSLVVKKSSNDVGPFESRFLLNGNTIGDGFTCLRIKAPQSFTCTMSALLTLLEKDYLTIAVQTNDTSGSHKHQSRTILTTSTTLSVTLVGDTRTQPSFQLSVKPRVKPYTTAANTISLKPLSQFTLPDSDPAFFQSAAMFSKLQSKNFDFHTGPQTVFYISSSVRFRLLGKGEVAAVIGSANESEKVYGWDHTKGVTSVLASTVVYDDHFRFNVSGKAPGSDFLWKPESSSVISGVSIGSSRSLSAFKARLLSLKPPTHCSERWARVRNWTEVMKIKNPVQIDNDRFEVLQSGSYFVFVNLVITSKTPDTVVDLGLFLDDKLTLFGSESTSKQAPQASVLLQGLLTMIKSQSLDLRIKCLSSSGVTFYKGITINAFRVDEPPAVPGLHWKLSYRHSYRRFPSQFLPGYSYGPRRQDATSYTMDAFYNSSEKSMTISRTGVYFVSVTARLKTHSATSLLFSTYSNLSSSSCGMAAPVVSFKDVSGRLSKAATINAFVFLKENQNFGVLDDYKGPYHYYHPYHSYRYPSAVYLSLHYMGELHTTSGLTSVLNQDKDIVSGANIELKDKIWKSGSTCGKFKTEDAPGVFGRYRVTYGGLHMVTFNLVLRYSQSCDTEICLAVNGDYIKGLHKLGCYERYLNDTSSNETVSTVGGSELLYLNEGEEVSVKLKKTCRLTITSQSSFSALYLGTRNAVFGFSSVIATKTATLTKLPTGSNHYYFIYGLTSSPVTYKIRGWTTEVTKTSMFFKTGVDFHFDDMFVCPRTGVYIILVKLHVEGSAMSGASGGCDVSSFLEVDGQKLDIGVTRGLSGEVNTVNTLSFTTTILLRKWQPLTVRFEHTRARCGQIKIQQGSSFAALYAAGETITPSLWPHIGPNIVEIPPRYTYIRKDKADITKLTCRAVGQHPISYQWIKRGETISNSTSLNVKKLNSTYNYVKCVVTMGEYVVESNTITVRFFDPRVVFTENYSNETYDIVEGNSTAGYTNVLMLSARVAQISYSYWYYERSLACAISSGNINDTFFIYPMYNRYGYSNQFFSLRARNDRIDRERIEEYQLGITCEDTNFPDARNATTSIHVVVLDANDNLPVFEKQLYNATIPKNLRPGEYVIQVMATDDDAEENGKITYHLLYTRDSYIFDIDKMSGVISLSSTGLLAKEVYILNVEARDHGSPPRSGYVTVVVDVSGYNPSRSSPHLVFEKREYDAYLISVAPVGTVVTVVHAYDPDIQDNRAVNYTIYRGDDSVFQVDCRRGVITTQAKLSVKTYELEIAAEFLKEPSGNDTRENPMNITRVIIKVQDVDPIRPNFLDSHYKDQVPEDASIGTSVLTVKAVEGHHPLNYSIPVAREAFTVNSRTGEIRVASKLDYETVRSYTFVVSVHDVSAPSRAACTDVTIDVVDVNDNTPMFVSYPTKIQLEKNITVGSSIGNVTAIDHDSKQNGKVTYYLVDDFTTFEINHDTGEIFTKRHPDCCDVVYNLKVEARDEGYPPRKASVTITITVTQEQGGHRHHGHGTKDKSTGSSHKLRTIIIASSCAIVAILACVFLFVCRKRRQRRQNFATATMNYISLPSDEDEALLDVAADNEDERRLSLISNNSAGSQENLIPNQTNC